MLFNSLQFCAFFVIVTTAYYLLPWRRRWQMLLAASCFFYMSFVPVYILIHFALLAQAKRAAQEAPTTAANS